MDTVRALDVGDRAVGVSTQRMYQILGKASAREKKVGRPPREEP